MPSRFMTAVLLTAVLVWPSSAQNTVRTVAPEAGGVTAVPAVSPNLSTTLSAPSLAAPSLTSPVLPAAVVPRTAQASAATAQAATARPIAAAAAQGPQASGVAERKSPGLLGPDGRPLRPAESTEADALLIPGAQTQGRGPASPQTPNVLDALFDGTKGLPLDMSSDGLPLRERLRVGTAPGEGLEAARAETRRAVAAAQGVAAEAASARTFQGRAMSLDDPCCGVAAPVMGVLLRRAGIPVDAVQAEFHTFLVRDAGGQVMVVDPTIRQFFGGKRAPAGVPQVFVGTLGELSALFQKHDAAKTTKYGMDRIYLSEAVVKNSLLAEASSLADASLKPGLRSPAEAVDDATYAPLKRALNRSGLAKPTAPANPAAPVDLDALEFKETREILDKALERFPPSRHYFIGVGRSPTLFMRLLRELDPKAGSNLPLSGLYSPPTAMPGYEPPLSAEETARLWEHFERFTPSAQTLAGRSLVGVDFAMGGKAARAFEEHYKRFLAAKRPGAALAMFVMAPGPSVEKVKAEVPGAEVLSLAPWRVAETRLRVSWRKSDSEYPGFSAPFVGSEKLAPQKAYDELFKAAPTPVNGVKAAQKGWLSSIKEFFFPTPAPDPAWDAVEAVFPAELAKLRALPKAEKAAYLRSVGDEVVQHLKTRFGTEEVGFHYNLHGGQAEDYVKGGGIRATMGDIALNYSMNADRNYKVYFFRSSGVNLYDVLNERHPNLVSSRMGNVLILFRLDSQYLKDAFASGLARNPTAIFIDFDESRLPRMVGIPKDTFLGPPLTVFTSVARRMGQGSLSRDEETLAVMRYLDAALSVPNKNTD